MCVCGCVSVCARFSQKPPGLVSNHGASQHGQSHPFGLVVWLRTWASNHKPTRTRAYPNQSKPTVGHLFDLELGEQKKNLAAKWLDCNHSTTTCAKILEKCKNPVFHVAAHSTTCAKMLENCKNPVFTLLPTQPLAQKCLKHAKIPCFTLLPTQPLAQKCLTNAKILCFTLLPTQPPLAQKCFKNATNA